MDVTLRDALNDWSAEQLGNLGSLLGLSDERHTIDEIEEQFKWLYHSKTRAHVKSAAQNASGFIRSVFEKSEHQSAEVEAAYEIPSYSLLISELAEKLDVKEDLASLADCEEFISHAVILNALQEMSPDQRRDFFNQPINTDEFCESSGMDNASLTGPVTTVAALGAAISVKLSCSWARSSSTSTAGLMFSSCAFILVCPLRRWGYSPPLL